MFTTGLYIRHQGACGTRLFDPLNPGHPLLEFECAACGQRFDPGDRTTLVPLGPGPDVEAMSKAMSGGWYNAVCAAVHAACAGMADEQPPPVPDVTPGREV